MLFLFFDFYHIVFVIKIIIAGLYTLPDNFYGSFHKSVFKIV
jgi:hypothetical protein